MSTLFIVEIALQGAPMIAPNVSKVSSSIGQLLTFSMCSAQNAHCS